MSKLKAVWDASECALILIDYQEEMFKRLHSSDPKAVERNILTAIKGARAFDIPIVLSTVGVEMGVNQPTIPSIVEALPGIEPIDRSSMDAWEDKAFHSAVRKTGRKRLVFGALYTEICLVYPVLEALKDGYEVAFLVDAVGGESKEEHDTAVQRLIQAGAVPNTTIAMVCEWFRDWKSPLATKGREVLMEALNEREIALGRSPMFKKKQPTRPEARH